MAKGIRTSGKQCVPLSINGQTLKSKTPSQKFLTHQSYRASTMHVGGVIIFQLVVESSSLNIIPVLFLNLSRLTPKEFPSGRTHFWVPQRTQNNIWRTAGLPNPFASAKVSIHELSIRKRLDKNYLCRNSSKAKTTSVSKQQIPKMFGKMLHSVSEQRENF